MPARTTAHSSTGAKCFRLEEDERELKKLTIPYLDVDAFSFQWWRLFTALLFLSRKLRIIYLSKFIIPNPFPFFCFIRKFASYFSIWWANIPLPDNFISTRVLFLLPFLSFSVSLLSPSLRHPAESSGLKEREREWCQRKAWQMYSPLFSKRD